jgi:hypothetical protein
MKIKYYSWGTSALPKASFRDHFHACNRRNGSATVVAPTPPTPPPEGKKNMQFRHFSLVDFNKYKSKACSLFTRTFTMMPVLFYQVCTGGIEELTERQSYNIGHMAVLGEEKGTFQTLRCNNFRTTKHFFNL